MLMPFIKALYDPQASLPQESMLYEKALEEIKRYSIGSQMHALIHQQGKWAQVPTFFQERLKQFSDETRCLNFFIKNQLDQILRQFETSHISIIPLKGVRFAEKYFGHFGARATSDIDVLIQKSDLDIAIRCLKSLGFDIEELRSPAHFHWSFSKRLPSSPIPLTVELHWNVLVEQTSNINMSEFWEHATPFASYQNVKELSVYHTFYMICLHGWSHYMDSPKYYMDIMQMLHRHPDDINFEVLFKDAASHQTLRRIHRTLVNVYGHFPHLGDIKELPVSYKKASSTSGSRYWVALANKIHNKFFNFDSASHTCAALIHAFYNLGNSRFSSRIKKF
ncbi:nucleotidyltransferase family protein [Paenibacillus plantarum]|nr:nucleotidyltransferase family protein [Paenibacillus plantarum]